ncbi:hypothetical protein [Salinimicrobium sp. HB62]|uniref:hypothetical protein n=1 Tax=Salinimicrobium sp. HB62 TaxID=3077781 RepID=UPI002D78A5D3|nr:hypothetical protein [Salinimicrobium sp. HB62]
MKKLLIALLILFLLFIGLTYWSVSVKPSEVYISKVVENSAVHPALKDSMPVTVVATNQYHANALKRFMQGVNYRRAWEAPVEAQVFLLDSFKIDKEGGGNQTKSLKIIDKKGIIYSLRSINKDPDPLIPKAAKILNLENIVIDGVSAQHPYGAVLAAELSEVVGVLSTKPRIVYVPKHKALEQFEDQYGNRLFLLEYETEGEMNWTHYKNVKEIVETDDLQELKAEIGEKLNIDRQQLVRARLFDLLIGDWDRHSKQWGWVLQQRNDHLVAIPIAGDRDNAFFRIDGVFPTILTNHLVQPMVRPFEEDIDYIPGFVYPFDLYFLKGVSKDLFISEARYIQQQLTDEKIDLAIKAWPKNLVRLNGNEIAAKLKSRRDKLVKYATEFHEVIEEKDAVQVPLKGSEDLDLPLSLIKCFDCQ